MPLAVLGALLVGFSLGILGAGGSILTVPVLTYLLGQNEKVAIAGSLAIVAGISSIGALSYARRSEIDWRSALWFGAPGMLGAWAGARLSEQLSGDVQLLLFAAIMLVAAWRMLRPVAAVAEQAPAVAPKAPRPVRVAATGLLVGAVTGLVGVGGGFLVVPALVLLAGLAMRQAIGTSLVVITANSLSGFTRHVGVLASLNLTLNWQIIGLFIAVGGAGTLVGNRLGMRVPQATLRRAFGMVLVCMATYVFVQERHVLQFIVEGVT